MMRLLAALATLSLVACSSASTGAPAGAGGGGPVCTACTAEEGEDCLGCWSKILDCCYRADERADAKPAEMAARCSDLAPCAACCNECAAQSCDELRAHGNCPNL
jgi:hypothetical protein